MSRIYVDNQRNQIVFEDVMDNEIVKNFPINELDKSIEKHEDMKGILRKAVDLIQSYIFDKEYTSRYIIYPSQKYRQDWINLIIEKTVYYLKLAELYENTNFNDYKADIRIHSYKNNTYNPYNPFDSLNDKNWESSGNGAYFTDKLGHVCIFCIKKDPSIKGGDVEFSPLYNDNEQNSISTICVPSHSLSVPLRTGSVVVLSGDVYHRIQPIFMKNDEEMYLITCYFYYGVRDH